MSQRNLATSCPQASARKEPLGFAREAGAREPRAAAHVARLLGEGAATAPHITAGSGGRRAAASETAVAATTATATAGAIQLRRFGARSASSAIIVG